jgi:hypothetical protein
VLAADFSFDIRLDTGLCDSLALLEDLTATVLRHAGCAPDAATALNGRLHEALEQLGRCAVCEVQFRAKSGELSVVFTDGAGGTWHGSYPVAGVSEPG